jgi:hypothetical protein
MITPPPVGGDELVECSSIKRVEFFATNHLEHKTHPFSARSITMAMARRNDSDEVEDYEPTDRSSAGHFSIGSDDDGK